MLGAALVLVFVAWLASTNGTLDIPISTTLEAVWKGISGRAAQLEGLEAIVWNLRLPRVVFGALVGATLAAAGAAMQGLFRNPLADPYLLGSATGAALGIAVLLVLIGVSPVAASNWGPRLGLTGAAFIGAVFAVLVTLGLARGVRLEPVADLRVKHSPIRSRATKVTVRRQFSETDFDLR